MDTNDLIERFRSHLITTSESADKMNRARNLYLDLVQEVNGLANDSREKSLAVTHLEDSMMWLNKAIARYQ